MKPVIGITCDYGYVNISNNFSVFGCYGQSRVAEGYYKAVEEVGGIPFLLPVINQENIEAALSKFDGIILSGGGDIGPIYFNEEPIVESGNIIPNRDIIEISIARKAIEDEIPILGICRGCQIMNIAGGGTIYQDIYSKIQDRKLIKHSQTAPLWYGTHKIFIEDNSKLKKIIKNKEIYVNSFHHQAINKVAEGFKIVARSQDVIIEAIEHEEHKFALGVQWHPERMWREDGRFLDIFKELINVSSKKTR